MGDQHIMFSDGGSRGNPGPAGIGFIIFEGSNLVSFDAQYIGEKTNNYAEYTALIEGLKNAQKLNIQNIVCYLDSELVVKQLNKEYKVRDENIKVLYDQVLEMIEKFSEISFEHVRREKNKFADRLVNIALDAAQNEKVKN